MKYILIPLVFIAAMLAVKKIADISDELSDLGGDL